MQYWLQTQKLLFFQLPIASLEHALLFDGNAVTEDHSNHTIRPDAILQKS